MNILDRLLIGPLKDVFNSLMVFLPTILTSFLILVLGVVLAGLIKAIFQRIFRALALDGFLERSGLSELLRKGGVKESISVLLARLFGWLTFLIFALTAISKLEILAIARIFENFLTYLPQVFSALFIFFIGYLGSNFFYRTALIAAVNAGNRLAGPMARTVKYLVVFLACTMAVEQLGIGSGTVVIAFAIIFGGVVFACAIAFGLGGRDMAKKFLEKNLRKEGEEKEKQDEISYL